MSVVCDILGAEKVQFILCSNEEVAESSFSRFDYVLGPGEGVTDMYALSECTLVIGPPSTFTIWGNFMTGVPVVNIGLDKLEDFSKSIESSHSRIQSV